MSSLEEIPAFSIWKMFYDTIVTIIGRVESSEGSVQRLAKIMKSKDYSNIFIYERDHSMPYSDYQRIADKYKTFTTWILGRFFYLLSREKLSKVHNVIIDAQLAILDQLAKSELHIYSEIAQEYSNALHTTAQLKHQQDLTVFLVEKQHDLGSHLNLNPITIQLTPATSEAFILNILKFTRRILGQSFDFQSFDAYTQRDLDDLLHLLSRCSFAVKFEILSIFIEIYRKIPPGGANEWKIARRIDEFGAFFQQIAREVYNERVELSQKQREYFEVLLCSFLEIYNDTEGLLKLVDFLAEKILSKDKYSGGNLLKVCLNLKKVHFDSELQFQGFTGFLPINYLDNPLSSLKSDVLHEVEDFLSQAEASKSEVNIYLRSVSEKYSRFHDSMLEKLDAVNFNEFLEFFNQLVPVLMEIRTHIKTPVNFFNEWAFLLKVIRNAGESCGKNGLIFRFLANLPLVYQPKNVLILLDIFYVALHKTPITPTSLTGCKDTSEFRKAITDFFQLLMRMEVDDREIMECFNQLISRVSINLYTYSQLEDIEAGFMKICRPFMLHQNEKLQCLIISNMPFVFALFNNVDSLVSEILTPALSSSNTAILTETIRILPKIICISSSDFAKTIELDSDGGITATISCGKCQNGRIGLVVMQRPCSKIHVDQSTLNVVIFRNLLTFITSNQPELIVEALATLPYCSNHILKFHSPNVVRMWADKCGDPHEVVRGKFADVIGAILQYGQDSPVISVKVKGEIIEILFNALMKFGKRALLQSDFPLQLSILLICEEVSKVCLDGTVLPLVKIFLYFIMVPTSKYSSIAVWKFFQLAKLHNVKTEQIYVQYKQEICQLIVHLCVVNQALVNYQLVNSLGKIASALEFLGVKDFISKECRYLLPYLVAKTMKMATVNQLIEEAAMLVNVTISEMLIGSYGNIFLHIFLHETKDDFKQAMLYLEKKTGLSGPILRKRNVRVILNELLLNFHEKKEQVEIALRLLAKEDTEVNSTTVQDYLQSHFLGILQHFDFKLMGRNSSRKDVVLLSLADLFRFMGPRHIGPLRFKIIAMLRTADYGGFPHLACEVWDAFVRSCEVEALGPQLATIFVSILPLLQNCPEKINRIFRYLIVDKEEGVKDFIRDLFFVGEGRIEAPVERVIRKYLNNNEDVALKDKIHRFLKYLTHETVEVRIGGFEHLKMLMERNREELDRMILGFNGIDPIIVELMDILMRSCREKNPALKLACGEVIGELGAVEPSHLPRRYSQKSRDFTFFISDDGFIVNALNELTKALQTEKNTISMDRFAVAIQEILKAYEISPVGGKSGVWNQFSESQQELMVPLLKSRYILAQSSDDHYPCPIYGTQVGASFQSWLYNWTCSLILTLQQENQGLLSVCLPAMKQNHRILMQFLPHILLHSLMGNNADDNREKAFIEIKTVTSAFEQKKKIDTGSLDVRPFPIPNKTVTIETITAEEVKQTQCTKTVFVLLDFLDRWMREWQWQKGLLGRDDPDYNNIKIFLGRFCKLQLARCNYHFGEYPRALMYLEAHIMENPHEMVNHLSFLGKIYAQLGEPDGMAGAIALHPGEPSIEDRILTLEVHGKQADAAACYERMPPPLQLHHLQGLVQCYLDLDNVNTALNFTQGAVDQQLNFNNTLFEMQAEPLWRLGRYEELDTLLKRPELANNNTNWGVQIGKALLAFQQGDRRNFTKILNMLKRQQVELLGAASLEEGSYQQGYCYISRLHALNELNQVEIATYELLLKGNDGVFVKNIIGNLAKEWDLRIKVVQESVRIIEPLLCLRRVAIESCRSILGGKVSNADLLFNNLLGECWLESGRTARAAGVHQQAYTYMLKAEEFAPPTLFLEKAKLHWLREEHEQALASLQRGLEIILPQPTKEAIAALPMEKKKMYAKAKLLIATYNDSISHVDTDVNMYNYKEAIDVYKEWEKSLVCFGQFYDRLFQAYSDEDRDAKGSDIQIHMIHCFGKSLQYGSTYVYQSMPRMLSIWFDYGTRLLDVKSSGVREERESKLLKMTKLIDTYLERLPAYVFLTAFSQLVSRICHPQREVYIELKEIIVKLLLQYPQQTLWMIISVAKSEYTLRARRCAEIFADDRLKTITMSKLVMDFTNLAEKLIELCNKDIPPDVEVTTVSSLMRVLPRILNKNDFSEIMIPTHKFRKLVLPNPDFSSGLHNPFPNHYVHIVGIDEEVTILRSLQRPRKITFRGSDGRGYIQMLKPKDDLRKDFRLMEFNDIVNQLLSREPEARQRRLNIRLYSVAPLNEECGLIEWVPNLVGLRPVVMTLYKQRGLSMRSKELKDNTCSMRDPIAKKRDVFTKVLLPRHPPILGEWFRRTFPDAQSWMFARMAYIRTTAVISMVGYVLGLGDRHGENILFDSTCGDTVHVDFNCLFNKGEGFEWPERVPFRLTQNMVSAMGPLGVEGVFRKSCECTLRVLRTNSATLMSIVTPFVYDPLVSWSKNAPANTTERTNGQAVEHIKNIDLRLQGIQKTKNRALTIPLSVYGQTNNLINEAISVDNLCQMYIGWGPYL